MTENTLFEAQIARAQAAMVRRLVEAGDEGVYRTQLGRLISNRLSGEQIDAWIRLVETGQYALPEGKKLKVEYVPTGGRTAMRLKIIDKQADAPYVLPATRAVPTSQGARASSYAEFRNREKS